jgi:hypothetical protein
VALALGAALGLGACSSEAADRAAVASAKCSLPVAEKAGLPEDAHPRKDAVKVEDLGKGSYRVTGRMGVVGAEHGSVNFVCEVAPDDSNKLRGIKVTRLEVSPIN